MQQSRPLHKVGKQNTTCSNVSHGNVFDTIDKENNWNHRIMMTMINIFYVVLWFVIIYSDDSNPLSSVFIDFHSKNRLIKWEHFTQFLILIMKKENCCGCRCSLLLYTHCIHPQYCRLTFCPTKLKLPPSFVVLCCCCFIVALATFRVFVVIIIKRLIWAFLAVVGFSRTRNGFSDFCCRMQ